MNPYITKDPAQSPVLAKLTNPAPVERNRLLLQMMSDRHLPRVLCAPALYGKSTVAYQYARLAFGVHRFFWVDAENPRFLLDLDEEGVAIEEAVGTTLPKLLVFDAVPKLDPSRAAAFSELVYAWLKRGWEVVITTRDPGLADRLRNRALLLPASALLLDGDEVSAALGDVQRWDAAPSAEVRIPCCGYGADHAHEQLLESLETKPLEDLVDAVELLCLLVGGGSLLDLQRLVPDTIAPFATRLGNRAPHCGVRETSFIYDPLRLTSNERVELVRSQGVALARMLEFASPAAFCEALANLLRDQGQLGFAARLVANLGTLERRCESLERDGFGLLIGGDALGALELVRSVGSQGSTMETALLQALCLSDLGDGVGADDAFEEACELATEGAERAGLLALRALGGTFVSRGWLQRAREALEQECDAREGEGEPWVQGNAVPQGEGDPWNTPSEGSTVIPLHGVGSPRSTLRTLRLVFERFSSSWEEGLAFIGEMRDQGAAPSVLFPCLVVGLRLGMELHPHASVGDSTVLQLIIETAETEVACLRPNRFEVELMACLDGALGPRHPLSEGTFAHRALMLTAHLKAQAVLLGEGLRNTHVLEPSVVAPSWERPARPSAPEPKACALRFFGGFELHLREGLKEEFAGGEALASKLVMEPTDDAKGAASAARSGDRVHVRLKGRLLITLLAVNHGRELPRAWVESVLWPDSDEASARTNFYALWSYVTRTIRAAGHEAFLVRTRDTVMMQDGFVVSDIARLEELLDRLASPLVPLEEQVLLLREMKELYRGPLLPGEEDENIAAYRSTWQKRVVDALASAAERIEGSGEQRLLEEFLSFAFYLDPTREDVCRMLMEVQSNLGCHAAATATFVRHQRISRESHGLSASRRLRRVYQEILDQVS